jgi:hypothetical protein
MPTLDWIGKKAVRGHHRAVPDHLLKCDRALSVGDPGTGNLLVQGDNLLALKALLPYYAGQVKCIYIDPPYNIGNEGWVDIVRAACGERHGSGHPYGRRPTLVPGFRPGNALPGRLPAEAAASREVGAVLPLRFWSRVLAREESVDFLVSYLTDQHALRTIQGGTRKTGAVCPSRLATALFRLDAGTSRDGASACFCS